MSEKTDPVSGLSIESMESVEPDEKILKIYKELFEVVIPDLEYFSI